MVHEEGERYDEVEEIPWCTRKARGMMSWKKYHGARRRREV